MHITINRPEQHNSINEQLIIDIENALTQAESNTQIKLIILEGKDGFFCTGMDFDEMVSRAVHGTQPLNREASARYMTLLQHLSSTPKIVVAKIDGQVLAGGVGLAAACDFVLASPRSQFALSEALWGLLPAMVIPFLIRRIGYQRAYTMTLLTSPIPASEAHQWGLIDILDDEIDTAIEKLTKRLQRIEISTIQTAKQFFKKMWYLSNEAEEFAVSESFRLASDPVVKNNIANFLHYRRFPWESDS